MLNKVTVIDEILDARSDILGQIGSFFILRGFVLAHSKIASNSKDLLYAVRMKCFGIIDSQKQRRHIWGFVPGRRQFIAEISFKNKEKLCFYVYGRENLERMKSLSEEIVEKFNISIDLHLKTEDVEWENFPEDSDM